MAHITPRRWRNTGPGQTLLHGPLTYFALSSCYEPGSRAIRRTPTYKSIFPHDHYASGLSDPPPGDPPQSERVVLRGVSA